MDISKKRLTGKLINALCALMKKEQQRKVDSVKILFIKLAKKCFDHSEGQYLVKLINIK